jgi:hypothetical protein
MFQIAGLNTLDLLLIVLLFIGILIGFVRGLGPQLMSLASIWFALLVSLYLYRPFSDNILQGLEFTKIVSDTISFLTMLFISFNAIRLLVRYLTKPPEQKMSKRKKRGVIGPVEVPKPSATQRYLLGPLNTFASMFMGLILMTLWIALLMGVIQFFFQTGAFTAGGVSQPGIVAQVQSSALMPYFNRVLRWLVLSVSLFVIESTPNILKVVVDRIFSPTG